MGTAIARFVCGLLEFGVRVTIFGVAVEGCLLAVMAWVAIYDTMREPFPFTWVACTCALALVGAWLLGRSAVRRMHLREP